MTVWRSGDSGCRKSSDRQWAISSFQATLFCGFLVLMTAGITTVDGVLRVGVVDAMWVASPKLRTRRPRTSDWRISRRCVSTQSSASLRLLFFSPGELVRWSTNIYNYYARHQLLACGVREHGVDAAGIASKPACGARGRARNCLRNLFHHDCRSHHRGNAGERSSLKFGAVYQSRPAQTSRWSYPSRGSLRSSLHRNDPLLS